MVAKVLASKPAQLAGVALAALSAVPMIGHLVATDAAAECNPQNPENPQSDPRPNNGDTYFSGWRRSSGTATVDGTLAAIEVRDTWVASPDHGGVVAWVMLAKQGVSRYAQIGWWERAGNVRQTLIQHKEGDGDVVTVNPALLPTPTPGAAPVYQLRYDPAGSFPDVFTYWQGFYQLWSGPAEWIPNEALQFGETKTLATQMPGGTLAKDDFTGDLPPENCTT